MSLSVPLSLLVAAMLLVSACVVPLPPPRTSALNTAEKAERPDWHVGDRWRYRSLHPAQPALRIDQVIRKEGNGYVIAYAHRPAARGSRVVLAIEPDANSEDHLTHTLALDRGIRGTGVGQYTPPFEWYRWPLEVGKQWTTDGSFKTTPPIGALFPRPEERYRVTFAVETYEEITVPAGGFKAFKIRARIHGAPPLGPLFHDDYVQWYAPAVKRYVRFEFPVGVDRGFAPPEISMRGWELMQFEPAPLP
jgi:hypothetical protein